MGSRTDSSLLFRVLDANVNRASEGLRVCEEVARMVLDDAVLTRRIQQIRHGLVQAAAKAGKKPALISARDSRTDVGRPALRGGNSRHRGYRDLVLANARRAEEALRVLEEFSRLTSVSAGAAFSRLRFQVYSVEQELLNRL